MNATTFTDQHVVPACLALDLSGITRVTVIRRLERLAKRDKLPQGCGLADIREGILKTKRWRWDISQDQAALLAPIIAGLEAIPMAERANVKANKEKNERIKRMAEES